MACTAIKGPSWHAVCSCQIWASLRVPSQTGCSCAQGIVFLPSTAALTRLVTRFTNALSLSTNKPLLQSTIQQGGACWLVHGIPTHSVRPAPDCKKLYLEKVSRPTSVQYCQRWTPILRCNLTLGPRRTPLSTLR